MKIKRQRLLASPTSALLRNLCVPSRPPRLRGKLFPIQNHLVAEYALSGIGNDRSTSFQAPLPAPIRLPRHSRRRRRALPEPLGTCLPSIEQIEAELGRIGDEES